MQITEIKKILVESFKGKLDNATDALLYSIYAEYLTQLEKNQEGVKTDEV